VAAPQELLTARLHLSPPRLQDAPALLAFMGDAEVMRHTYRQASLRTMRRHIAGHAWQARRLGFGVWTVRHEGRVVGFGGLNDDPFDPGYGPEVAYFFAREAWGRGFAGELVAASLEEARRLGLPAVRAFVHPDNAPSRRVLERAGFTVERWIPDMTRWLLRIELGRPA
jgi:RimJ/RimL family protein N-acetyltransferase